jgi:hypothetical protein
MRKASAFQLFLFVRLPRAELNIFAMPISGVFEPKFDAIVSLLVATYNPSAATEEGNYKTVCANEV